MQESKRINIVMFFGIFVLAIAIFLGHIAIKSLQFQADISQQILEMDTSIMLMNCKDIQNILLALETIGIEYYDVPIDSLIKIYDRTIEEIEQRRNDDLLSRH